MKWIFFSLCVVIIITLLMSLQDDVFLNQYKTGVFYKDLILLIDYYVHWVLTYWWFNILLSSVLSGLLLEGSDFIFKKFKDR